MVDDDVYTFTMVQSNGTTITVSSNKCQLGEIINDFEQWLLGCTFHRETVDKYLHHSACHDIIDHKGNAVTKCFTEINQ